MEQNQKDDDHHGDETKTLSDWKKKRELKRRLRQLHALEENEQEGVGGGSAVVDDAAAGGGVLQHEEREKLENTSNDNNNNNHDGGGQQSDDDDDDDEPLLTAAKKRKIDEQKALSLLLRSGQGEGNSGSINSSKTSRRRLRILENKLHSGGGGDGSDQLIDSLQHGGSVHRRRAEEEGDDNGPSAAEAAVARGLKDSGDNKVKEKDNDSSVVQTNAETAAAADTSTNPTEKAVQEKDNTNEKEQQQAQTQPPRSLLDQAADLQKTMSAADRAAQHRQEEEARLLRHAQNVGGGALKSAKQAAQGVVYTKPMPSTWRVPRYILNQANNNNNSTANNGTPLTLQQQQPAAWQKIRKEWHIDVEGNDIPPPLTRFADMKLPLPILNLLQKKGIARPTPIQMQGIPVALSGRDMVGIAFTGSGKTLTFGLPLVMAAWEEELRMPIQPGEGPIGLVLAPSRELARQTYEVVTEFCNALVQAHQENNNSNNNNRHHHYHGPSPQLHTLLLVGGESLRDQVDAVQKHGVHCVVATPGRLRGILKQRTSMNLLNCRFVCLDEADRMLDLGFDEEVGDIFNFFVRQKQTLLFSATFPRKFQDFARQTLVQPIVVNVGRAGAANLDVIQEVEYVKQDAKIVYLLHCLQKTAPPVCIFSKLQREVDDIHEYLLLKGVEAVSIHGGKEQSERNEAIELFKQGKKDVLIATDVAAKGLDFPNIQHVINFDMPDEIENYVHRVGRTGRCGKTGVATTFINKSCDEMTLLDLKGLLQEARQRIPPVLEMLEDPRRDINKNNADGGAAGGCSFCGGLGHTIVDCPKIEKDAKRIQRGHHDALQMGGGDW